MPDDADSWDALVREHELLWGLGTVALPLDGLRAALAREGYLEQPPLRGLSSRASFEVLASAAGLRRGDDFELGSSERNMWLVMRDVGRLCKLSCQPADAVLRAFAERIADWRRCERAALVVQRRAVDRWRARRSAHLSAAAICIQQINRNRQRRVKEVTKPTELTAAAVAEEVFEAGEPQDVEQAEAVLVRHVVEEEEPEAEEEEEEEEEEHLWTERIFEVTLVRLSEDESLGISVGFDENGAALLLSCAPGTPADRCGALKIDDQIVAVGGRSVSVLTNFTELLVNEGLEVTLTVSRLVHSVKEDKVAPLTAAAMMQQPQEEQDAAATVLQSAVRTKKARKVKQELSGEEMTERRDATRSGETRRDATRSGEERRDAAAAVVQPALRGTKPTKKKAEEFQQKWEEEEEEEEKNKQRKAEQEKEVAAIQLQAVRRGQRDRRAFREKADARASLQAVHSPEPFVPEEEEDGAFTQGDGLMMAKARRSPARPSLEPLIRSAAASAAAEPAPAADAPPAAATAPVADVPSADATAPAAATAEPSDEPSRLTALFERPAATALITAPEPSRRAAVPMPATPQREQLEALRCEEEEAAVQAAAKAEAQADEDDSHRRATVARAKAKAEDDAATKLQAARRGRAGRSKAIAARDEAKAENAAAPAANAPATAAPAAAAPAADAPAAAAPAAVAHSFPSTPSIPKLPLPRRPHLSGLSTDEQARVQATMSDEELRTSQRMFAKFDFDGDGVVSRDDFRAAMRAMGSRGRSHEVSTLDAMFDAVDTDGDGLVHFVDFVRMQVRKQQKVPPPAAAPAEAQSRVGTLKRNSAGRFGISFHSPGDGTIRLENISDAHDVDDERKLLCVGDIVLSINGVAFEESPSEEELLRLVANSGQHVVLRVAHPSETPPAAAPAPSRFASTILTTPIAPPMATSASAPIVASPIAASPMEIRMDLGEDAPDWLVDASVHVAAMASVSGWLEKRSGSKGPNKVKLLEKWDKRWFVLRGSTLCYYKNEELSKSDQPPSGTLECAGAHLSQSTKGQVFRFAVESAERELKLRAPTFAEYDMWTQAIRLFAASGTNASEGTPGAVEGTPGASSSPSSSTAGSPIMSARHPLVPMVAPVAAPSGTSAAATALIMAEGKRVTGGTERKHGAVVGTARKGAKACVRSGDMSITISLGGSSGAGAGSARAAAAAGGGSLAAAGAVAGLPMAAPPLTAAQPASDPFAQAVLGTYQLLCPDGDGRVDAPCWARLMGQITSAYGIVVPAAQLAALFEAAIEESGDGGAGARHGAPAYVDVRRIAQMSSIGRYFSILRQARAEAQAQAQAEAQAHAWRSFVAQAQADAEAQTHAQALQHLQHTSQAAHRPPSPSLQVPHSPSLSSRRSLSPSPSPHPHPLQARSLQPAMAELNARTSGRLVTSKPIAATAVGALPPKASSQSRAQRSALCGGCISSTSSTGRSSTSGSNRAVRVLSTAAAALSLLGGTTKASQPISTAAVRQPSSRRNGASSSRR